MVSKILLFSFQIVFRGIQVIACYSPFSVQFQVVVLQEMDWSCWVTNMVDMIFSPFLPRRFCDSIHSTCNLFEWMNYSAYTISVDCRRFSACYIWIFMAFLLFIEVYLSVVDWLNLEMYPFCLNFQFNILMVKH